MGRFITTTGTASSVTRTVSSNFNATANDRILANTSAGAFTITLPTNASTIEGDVIQIIDVGNSFNTNNITVGRNGSLILGLAENLTLDVNGAIVTLLYTGSTYGWVLTSS